MSATRNHVTVVETLYHQPDEQQPTSVQARFVRWLSTDEQPYNRRVKVGVEWGRIDTGWVKAASFVVLTNEEGSFTQTVPTPEEKAEAMAKVVEVGVETVCNVTVPAFRIPPGESLRFSPVDLSAIQLRCRSGVARITVAAFPE